MNLYRPSAQEILFFAGFAQAHGRECEVELAQLDLGTVSARRESVSAGKVRGTVLEPVRDQLLVVRFVVAQPNLVQLDVAFGAQRIHQHACPELDGLSEVGVKGNIDLRGRSLRQRKLVQRSLDGAQLAVKTVGGYPIVQVHQTIVDRQLGDGERDRRRVARLRGFRRPVQLFSYMHPIYAAIFVAAYEQLRRGEC